MGDRLRDNDGGSAATSKVAETRGALDHGLRDDVQCGGSGRRE